MALAQFDIMSEHSGAPACLNTRGMADPGKGTDMPDATCSVEGCERAAHAREWCKSHYMRWWNHGHHLASGQPRHLNALLWLEHAVAVALGSDCDECLLTWPWSRSRDGYCRVWDGQRRRFAHQIVLELTGQFAPSPTHQGRHLCGKGHLGCLHPRHLAWGTPAENSADKVTHGRVQRGDNNGNARLTEEQVRIIRTSRDAAYVLAAQFGVSKTTVAQVRRGETWSWVS